MTDFCRVVVLISGGGSNLQAVMDQAQDYKVCSVISNNAHAYGLQRAVKAGIPTRCLSPKHHTGRSDYDRALADTVAGFDPDLVLLAGYMLILSTPFVQRFSERLLNIHPSLLPKHKGLDTHTRVLESGDTEHGCSVHFVVPELDAGPVVMQSRLAIRAGDDAKILSARVQTQEHRLYPTVVKLFALGRLRLIDGVAFLDGRALDQPLQLDYA